MTTNRLAIPDVAAKIVPPKDRAERERFWIARGNRILWGEEATTKGDFLEPRRDLEWRCDNGNYYIAPRFSRAV